MEVVIVILALFIGYFIGRIERGKQAEEEDAVGEDGIPGTADKQTDIGQSIGKRFKSEERGVPNGNGISSPAEGTVSFFCEGGRKGAVIEPAQGVVYAPASGKITKLYPMGNSFVLRADDGTELLIQVGRRQPDELCSMYYRPHIVQNEIINKGKLLLSFDMERLRAAGEEVSVAVSFKDSVKSKEVTVTRKEQVKVGEELMWVSEKE